MNLTINIPNTVYELILNGDADFISKEALISVIKNGKSVSEAKEPVKRGRPKKEYTDHTGRKFPSRLARNEYYGLGRTTIEDRLRMGWSLEKACTTPLIKDMSKHMREVNNFNVPCVECEDHKGNKYESIGLLCATYNIPRGVYSKRKARGWNLEKILTTPVKTA